MLNHMFAGDYLDVHFIRIEESLFGLQPCLWLMDAFPYLAVSEVLYASYFSYYIMIFGVGLALFVRQRRQFYCTMSVVSFVFYLCYLHLHLPACHGAARLLPRDRRVPAARCDPGFRGPVGVSGCRDARSVFFNIMAWIYRNFESPGAAFPSSHVAIALCTVWFSFRYLPRIRWLHLGVALLPVSFDRLLPLSLRGRCRRRRPDASPSSCPWRIVSTIGFRRARKAIGDRGLR